MKPEKIIEEISGLGLSEKLMLVEGIRNPVVNHSETSTPEWQKQELDQRYKDYQAGKLELHNWKVVHEDLRQKYK